MSEWRDISTAPRGPEVLISDGKSVTVASYIYGENSTSPCSQHIQRPITKGENWFLSETGSYADDAEPSFDPTMWAEIPRLPKTASLAPQTETPQ